MTERDAKTIALSEQQLGDINTLRNTEAFNRYYLTRLAARSAAIEKKFRTEVCSHEQRECYRQLLLEYDSLLRLLDEGEAAARGAMR